MGLLNDIFRPLQNQPMQEAVHAARYFETLTAYRPHFTSWDGAIYESDLVRAAIDARARHISKLKVEIHGTARPALQSKLRQGPNQWQTYSQFLYRTSTILDVHTTAIIVPVYDQDMITTGYFTVLPTRCELVDVNGTPLLRYTFRNNKTAAAPLAECCVLTRFQHSSDFFGDGNHALNETMKLIHINNQGIEEAVKNSATFRFMATYNNLTKAGDLAKERQRFNRENLSAEAEGENGILLFPSSYNNVKQIESRPYTVDAEQMAQIRTSVADYFGVNEKIMQSSASADELDSFFNSVIEPFSIQLSEGMTRALFTERERAQGSYLVANANRLQYMSTAAKVQMAKELGDRGALMIDEIRELFNYPPLPDGAGQVAPIRGEYKATDELTGEDSENE